MFPVSLVLTLIGASLPGGLATSALWLLPALAMTLLTLGLEPKFGPARVSGIVGLCWLGLIGGT